MAIKRICKGNNNIQVSGNLTILEPGKNVTTNISIMDVDATKHCSCISSKEIWLNGEKLPMPPKGNAQNVEVVNNHIWVNGYYWTGIEWKRMSKFKFKIMRKK